MQNKNLSTFVSDQFGSIRTLNIDGEPWFVAADVCRALGLEQTHKALHRLDSDEVGGGIKIPHPQSPEKTIEVSIVSESGLYSLVLASRKPEAKAFKRWITHEVIPAIRKTGAYAVPGTPMMTAEQAAVLLESMHAFVQNQSEFLACASKVLDAMNAFTDVSQKLVQAVIDAKALPAASGKPAPKPEQAKDKPKAVPANQHVSDGAITLEEAALRLGTTRKNICDALRVARICYRQGNNDARPYRVYTERGLFDKIIVKYYRCGAEETQTLVTPTGLDLLAQILEDEKL